MNEEEYTYDEGDWDEMGIQGLPKTENFLFNMMLYIRTHLENASNYCFICLDKHLADSIKLRPCSKDICEFR
jgi:hypothetical protein